MANGRHRSRAAAIAAGVPLNAEEVRAVGLRHEGLSFATLVERMVEGTGKKPRSKDWAWHLMQDPRAVALLQQLRDDDRDAISRRHIKAAMNAHAAEDEAARVLRLEMTRPNDKGGASALRIAAAQALARIAHNRLARMQSATEAERRAVEGDTLQVVITQEGAEAIAREAGD